MDPEKMIESIVRKQVSFVNNIILDSLYVY